MILTTSKTYTNKINDSKENYQFGDNVLIYYQILKTQM